LIARNRAAASLPDTVAGIVLVGATIAAAALLVHGSPAGAALPLALASLALVVRPPRAMYLRTIGVVLVVASLAAGGLVAATL
jgi:hypothetical protein